MPQIIYLEQTASTNSYVKALLNKSYPPELTYYIARDQTFGRGQQTNKWISEPYKNHTGTIIFYPGFLAPVKHFQISKLVSLGLISTLSRYLKAAELSIKWPNDIYFQEQKIAGILIEGALSGDRYDYIIAGTGVNVNQKEFPSSLPNPVSIHQILGHRIELARFNKALQDDITKHYNQNYLISPSIDNDYLSSLYRFGESCWFRTGDVRFKARIRGVNPHGHLLLEHSGGLIKPYAFKEVEYLF
ncbi:MAG: biotin--[acetyl-CoA-carboxylase] ligase [Bacteroidales bacterium]